MLTNYFGGEVCGLNDKIITRAVETLFNAKPVWISEVNNSFLSGDMKNKYTVLIESRINRLDV